MRDALTRWGDRAGDATPRRGYDCVVEDDDQLVERVCSGDQSAFTLLVSRYHPSLVRVARYYVSAASAEDVAQETWIAVLRGVSNFEGRSSFKTWLFRILVNRAQTTGVREHRTIAVDPSESGDLASSQFDSGGAWRVPPQPFSEVVENSMVNEPLVRLTRAAIARLPAAQQAVVTLRDVQGLSTTEVAALLTLSEANVRVILHRGRSRVRSDVEIRLQGESR